MGLHIGAPQSGAHEKTCPPLPAPLPTFFRHALGRASGPASSSLEAPAAHSPYSTSSMDSSRGPGAVFRVSHALEGSSLRPPTE